MTGKRYRQRGESVDILALITVQRLDGYTFWAILLALVRVNALGATLSLSRHR